MVRSKIQKPLFESAQQLQSLENPVFSVLLVFSALMLDRILFSHLFVKGCGLNYGKTADNEHAKRQASAARVVSTDGAHAGEGKNENAAVHI